MNNGGTTSLGEPIVVLYWVVSNNGGGDTAGNGCNPADGTSLTVTPASLPGLTASPTSVTITGCGIGAGQKITYTSTAITNYVIPVSIADTDSTDKYSIPPATVWLTFVDDAPPEIGTNPNLTAEATSADGASVDFDTPSATDAVDENVDVSCDHASGDTFPLGDTQVNCTATDGSGNSASSFFDVFVEDTTAPTIDSHDGVIAEATSADGASVDFDSPATHDAVDGDGTATCSPASDSQFGLGDTQVNCTAVDNAGNEADSVAFTVSVEDTTPPTIGTNPNLIAEASGPGGASVGYDSPATHDAVDGDGTATCSPASGSTFPLGHTQVNCTATDDSGNSASSSFDVSVEDTTAPTIDSHDDVTVQATSGSGILFTSGLFTPPATHDLVDGDGVSTCTPPPNSTFPTGTTTVTCTATDLHGNGPVSTTFNVTVLSYQKLTMGAGIDLGKGNTASGNIQFDGTTTTGSIVFKGSTIDFKSKSLTFDSVSADGKTIYAHGSGVSGKANTPLTFTLQATDNGEPGKNDSFTITFSNGYIASGTLAKGNIQVHK